MKKQLAENLLNFIFRYTFMYPCYYHSDKEAIASCHECDKHICNLCSKTIDRGHETRTLGGSKRVNHSYHTVCPECYKKFKKKVKGIKIFLVIAMVPLLLYYLTTYLL